MNKKANLESPEDTKNYIDYLSEVAREVDGWPPEKKTRRHTVFYEDLKTPQNKETEKVKEHHPMYAKS